MIMPQAHDDGDDGMQCGMGVVGCSHFFWLSVNSQKAIYMGN
jgi:hypothetical protein